MSLLSPLRPILRNGNQLLKFLGNAFTGERILQCLTPRHLWATGRPRMCYPTCQQLPWCPAHEHTSNVASPTKKSIVVVAVDVKKIQTTKKTRGSDMVPTPRNFPKYLVSWPCASSGFAKWPGTLSFISDMFLLATTTPTSLPKLYLPINTTPSAQF